MSWLEYNKKITKTLKGPNPVPKESKPLEVVPPRLDDGRETRLYEVKRRVHHCLLERLDLSQLEELDEKLRAKEIRQAISMLLEEEKEPLNMRERARLAREMEFEILGLGPLEPLLLDPAISDILVNRYNQVYVERKGRLELTDVRFQDNEHLLKIINKIVSNVGRRIDESVPMVDARLADGSRVNAIISPLTLDGSML
ncbi:MAG: Flp pilus assembly complex ATPase component TadA, partial [Proteobacteria bacterium]|nr:Flp pilus assembly complex ATPase component TadA [Pseudomonadota bacterium]